MSKEGTEKKPVDLNDVEMVFGSPETSVPHKPDIHITNEKNPAKEDLKPADSERAGHESDMEHPTQPLLEHERGRAKPPLAGPEVDDLDEENPTTVVVERPHGIDDGLLEDTNGPKADGEHEKAEGDGHLAHDDVGTNDGKWLDMERTHGVDETDFYTYGDGYIGNGINNRFDERAGSPMPGSIPDVNTYQQKKNLAQGMMDLALLSANANQLRYVLESSNTHPYYISSLVFISCSILLQVAVGVGLIMNSRYNVKDEKDICKADKINNMTVLGIFLITIVNVFITSFSVATPTAVQQTG